MSLVSSAPDALLVSAEADLEAAPQGAGHTRILLSARYSMRTPPACDRRAVRWTIQDYTRRLGARIADHLLDSAAV
ncbi:MAG: hypothetical protein J2P39_13110 [Candidatus Dormibacteraeota bacterium]|nr:hypothetical protein [Candidatus Dormibacteraeota bacterium]